MYFTLAHSHSVDATVCLCCYFGTYFRTGALTHLGTVAKIHHFPSDA